MLAVSLLLLCLLCFLGVSSLLLARGLLSLTLKLNPGVCCLHSPLFLSLLFDLSPLSSLPSDLFCVFVPTVFGSVICTHSANLTLIFAVSGAIVELTQSDLNTVLLR